MDIKMADVTLHIDEDTTHDKREAFRDSLLNLSPTGDDVWIFYNATTVRYTIDGTTVDTVVNWLKVGFENDPISVVNNDGVLQYVDTQI